MKAYMVSGMITVSVYTRVEAESKEEAIEIAESRVDIERTQWGDDAIMNHAWINDEYDGDIVGIKVDED